MQSKADAFPSAKGRRGFSRRVLRWQRILLLCLFLALWLYSTFNKAHAQSTLTAQTPAGAVTAVPDGGFELPSLAFGSFVARPGLTAWTFTGFSGVSSNGSGYTSGNPNAPEGTQVLWIKLTGQVVQTVNVSTSGVYRVRLKAALRANMPNQAQTIGVLVDGDTLGKFPLTDINYQDFQTLPIHLTAGNHTLQLNSLIQTGDNTGFVDAVELERLPEWGDAATWSPAQVPTPGDTVVIPGGTTVALNGNHEAKIVTVNGTLAAAQNKDFELTSYWLMIMGSGALLEVGREEIRYEGKGIFTLKGEADTQPLHPAMDNKFIGAMMGGALELHGQHRLSWSKLDAKADSGATQIQLLNPVDWELGDSIVITGTDFKPDQAEAKIIQAISNDGKTITLGSPLNYMRWGQDVTYPGSSLKMDQRGEAALLTRNIVIQGDQASTSSRYGAHVMIMVNSVAHVEGVEFLRVGQLQKLGRYPFHWHQCGNVNGQYLKFASIHRSWNRAVTVHTTDSALIWGVVAYDHIGHGFFLENGDERFNRFFYNLGVMTRAPKVGEELLPHDRVAQGVHLKTPATYWITNPQNDFVGNIAAGSEGSGFWMVSLEGPIDGNPGYTGRPPYQLPMGRMDYNLIHSSSFSNFAIDGKINENDELIDLGHYRPENDDGSQFVPVINNMTAYRCRNRNVWIRANEMHFNHCVLGESPRITFFSFHQHLLNSMVVGVGPNPGNPETVTEIAVGRTLPNHPQPASANQNRIEGYPLYDGPIVYDGVHFAGFEPDNVYCVAPQGAAQKSPAHRCRNLSFEPGIQEDDKIFFHNISWMNHIYSSGLIDEDGSLSSNTIAGTRLTPRILPPAGAPAYRLYDSLNIHPDGTFIPAWNAWKSDGVHYGLYWLNNIWDQDNAEPIYAIRHDGPAVFDEPQGGGRNQNPVMVSDTFEYAMQYHKLNKRIDPWLRYLRQNDELVVQYTNVPSSTRLYDTSNNLINPASSLFAVLSSGTQAYIVQDNTLYIKHVGTEPGDDWQFGSLNNYASPKVRICQEENCADPHSWLDYMTFADFEKGADSRVRVNGTFTGGLPQETYDAVVDPFDEVDSKVYWEITTDGDPGTDKYVQLLFVFERQIWNEFKTMKLNFSGAPVDVYVYDETYAGGSFFQIGSNVQPGEVYLDMTAGQDVVSGNYQRFDEVTRLILRTRESYVGNTSSVTTTQLSLSEILLYDTVVTGSNKVVDVRGGGGRGNSDGKPHEFERLTGQSVAVYPNPSSGELKVAVEGYGGQTVKVKLVSLQGKVLLVSKEAILADEGRKVFRLDIGPLPAGSYLVQVEGEAGLVTRKLVLKN